MSMNISCVFLTRACPRHCGYCRIRDSNLTSRELTGPEWQKAFDILKNNMKTEFNLVIGNEVLMLQDSLIDLTKYLNNTNTAYGYYTTFPEPLWSKWRDALLEAKVYNLSCGIDTLARITHQHDDITKKSQDGLRWLTWAKKNGVPDVHATITLSKINIGYVDLLVKELTNRGIWCAINPIHHNKGDEMFDFFPPKEEIKDIVFTKEDQPRLSKMSNILKTMSKCGHYLIQNPPEFFDDLRLHTIRQSWHCKYPILFTVDADGTMRTCAYRRGDRVSNYSIFDFTDLDTFEEYKKDLQADMADCSGCLWFCWWNADYHFARNTQKGIDSFVSHKVEHYKGGKKNES